MFNLECEVCQMDQLYLDDIAQLESIPFEDVATYKDLERYVDNELSKLLVFRCANCGNIVNYTIKSLLEARRQQVKDYVLEQLLAYRSFILRSDISKGYALIYCGKCSGQDGKGSCRVEFYNECNIKEMPVG